MNNLLLHIDQHVATVSIHRPDVRNAFDDHVIRELTHVFTHMDAAIRVIVLTGTGDTFSAGADLRWMRDSAQQTSDHNREDAQALAELFGCIDACPQVVLARVNGAAMGGAAGLVACSDIAVASTQARFAFSEVRLGLVPAVISPFVIRRVGATMARRYFLTGEMIDAAVAKDMQLVHEVVAPEQLDARVAELTRLLLQNGPQALREVKELVRQVGHLSRADVSIYTVDTIARVRASDEGQEGLSAFLEKRKPNWI